MLARRLGAIAVLAFVVVGFFAGAPRARSQVSRPSQPSALTRLAEQRLQLATRGYDTAVEGVRHGRAAPTAVAEWARRRASAALDLPDVAQRTAVLKDSIKVLKDQVNLIERGVRAGVASQEELLLAQDRELECELWLAKAGEQR